jgi:hypothetical protein
MRRIPDGYGVTATTVGMAITTSGFVALGRIHRMRAPLGFRIIGNGAETAGSW